MRNKLIFMAEYGRKLFLEIDDIKLKKLIDEQKLQQGIKALARKLDNIFKHEKDLVMIVILNGALFFFSDLLKYMHKKDIIIDTIVATSYENNQSTGQLKIVKDISKDIKDKTVILIEDIYDSGLTLYEINKHLQDKHKPKQIYNCVLINVQRKKTFDIKIDFDVFLIKEGMFLVGYGLDFNDKYRNLNAIYIKE